MSNPECSYCEEPAQGNYSIHRDGMGEGPEVPLCDECGGHPTPTEHEIWLVISPIYRKRTVARYKARRSY